MTKAEINRRYRARLRGEKIPLLHRPYTDAEKGIIASAYSGLFNLEALAKRLNRPKYDICRVARKMGLTNKNRKKPRYVKKPVVPRQRVIPGFSSAGVWNRNPHPRGMLNKTHSQEVRNAMSVRMKRTWADPNSVLNSDSMRQARSDAMVIQRSQNPITNPYSRALKGRRPDLNNQFFKSRWEANFARYLNFLKKSGNIYDWKYEEDRFMFEAIKRGTRSYCPDFKVWDTLDAIPYYYEIKGWMDPKSITRLKRMAKYYPHVKIILIGAKEYKELERKIRPLLLNWESKT